MADQHHLFQKINYFKDTSTTFRCVYLTVIFTTTAIIFRYGCEAMSILPKSPSLWALVGRAHLGGPLFIALLVSLGSAKQPITPGQPSLSLKKHPCLYRFQKIINQNTLAFISWNSFIIISIGFAVELIFHWFDHPFQSWWVLFIHSLTWTVPAAVTFSLLLSPGVQSGFTKH